MTPTRKRTLLYAIIAVASVLLIGAAFLCAYLWEKDHSDFNSDSDFIMSDVLVYDGEQYTLRSSVETVLVMGIDKFSDEVEDGSYNNDQRADFLVLFVIDHKANTYSSIQLNRDTITDVTVLGIGGKKVGTVKQQLALAHTYGSGGDDSCRNTARAVAAIFGGMRIDHYVSLTMDAVSVLNDTVGGVTLEVLADLTAIDPTLVKGETVTLTAEQALTYVRARSELEDSTNLARMERQHQYLDALYAKMIDYISENESFPTETSTKLSKYMVTNCSTAKMESLFDRLSHYTNNGIQEIEGEIVVNEYVEFYPNENSIKRLLATLFYEPKK